MARVKFEDWTPTSEVVWAVYDGRRLKCYSNRGHALNRVAAHVRAKLYRFDDQGWELLAVKGGRPEADMYVCDNCKGDTREPHDHFVGNFMNTGKFVWERAQGKITDPPTLLYLCRGCRQAFGF